MKLSKAIGEAVKDTCNQTWGINYYVIEAKNGEFQVTTDTSLVTRDNKFAKARRNGRGEIVVKLY